MITWSGLYYQHKVLATEYLPQKPPGSSVAQGTTLLPHDPTIDGTITKKWRGTTQDPMPLRAWASWTGQANA
jgi:hypothetical protein